MASWSVLARQTLRTRQGAVAAVALAGIAAYLLVLWLVPAARAPDGDGAETAWWANIPLWVPLALGGIPLLVDIAGALWRREPGADLIAALAIITSVLLGEYLVGAIIVLMLSGGEALEQAATRRASAVLEALAARNPSLAHRRDSQGRLTDVAAADVAVGDVLVILPHELCPVDGEVVEGHGAMDESYLTGEPWVISKTPGASVLSGAVNGAAPLVVRASRRAADSRYAQIVAVLEEAEQNRPPIRRIADRLGAWYAAIALAFGAAALLVSGGDWTRFLAVMVIATPCPLLIAVPVAIVGAISLSAKQAVIIKDPGALEEIDRCRTLIFDKTGTLTYGRPVLTEILLPESSANDAVQRERVLAMAASLEHYSKHPLARAIVAAANVEGLPTAEVHEISERPGAGLRGRTDGHQVWLTSRTSLREELPDQATELPPLSEGLECVVAIDGRYAATMRFRDEPRPGTELFVRHLHPRHGVSRTMVISGDRASEVHYLAERVGIDTVYAEQSPEQKLELVRAETAQARTLYLGDGINDAPAMTAATVGVAFGHNSDITAEAADAVILDTSLEKLDELLHIGERMRRIALQSAVGGILASLVGMLLAVFGYLPPLAGAILQEVIDLVAVLNAARVAARTREMSDFASYGS